MAEKLFCGRMVKTRFDNQIAIISLSVDDLNALYANLNKETGKVHLIVNTNKAGKVYSEIDLWYRDNGRDREQSDTPANKPPVKQNKFEQEDRPPDMPDEWKNPGDTKDSEIPF